MLMLKDCNYKTLNTDTLNLDETKFVYKKNYLGKDSPSYPDPKYARNGRNDECSRTTS